MAQKKSIGPYPQGMDQVSKETSMPTDRSHNVTACRSAQNIDFDREGEYTRRDGFTKLFTGAGFHSMFSARKSLFVCQGNTLGVYDPLSVTFYPKADMPSAYRTDYVELNKTVYASNPAFNCRFPPGSLVAYPLAVPIPTPTPTWDATEAGALESGDYTVAYSILNADKEESPLFGESQLTVEQGGGIVLIGVPIDPTSFIRIYATTANGEELYQVIEAPMSAVSYLIGATEVSAGGQQPETRFKTEMPPGHFIEKLGGRLLVARDNQVIWSEAFRPHLTDLRHNFVTMESTITMLKAVDGGVFISDGESVIFLDNEDPDKFAPKDVDADPAFFGSSVEVPGAAIGSEADHAVIWLSAHGHIAGLPGGGIKRLNSEQLLLPDYSITSGVYIERKGLKQVIIPVNSERREGTGTAIDSSIY